MRVAFVVGAFPVLSQTFVLNQITGLLDLGLEVDIYSQRLGDRGSQVHPDVLEYNLLERTRYFFPEKSQNLFSKVARVTKNFAAICLAKPTWTLRAVQCCLREGSLAPISLFRQLIDAPAYDVIQCHFGYTAPIGIVFKELGLAQKVIVTFHAHELTNKLTPRQAKLYRQWSEDIDLLTPVSYLWKESLAEMGCPPQKILVHRMAVDMDRFEFRVRKPGPSLRLLTVARLVEKKGIEYAIRAVSIIQESHPHIDVSLNIVGDGELRSSLESLRISLGLEDSVHFLGWLDQDEVRQEMRAADVFVLPSVTAADGGKEGVPVSLMEAMASGIPVVSTTHSGIPELVEDGVSGYLVGEHDVAALAHRICQFVDTPKLAETMGRAGRAFVDRNYNIATLNQRLSWIYTQLLQNEPLIDFERANALKIAEPEPPSDRVTGLGEAPAA
ncbi:MAG: glycosyltransferase [Dehalococcoidia bacterium]